MKTLVQLKRRRPAEERREEANATMQIILAKAELVGGYKPRIYAKADKEVLIPRSPCHLH